jgi:HEAT repeat protein
MVLLRPLLLDTVPSIQHNAAQALGRLANHSPELAEQVVNADILPQLVYSLNNQNVNCYSVFFILFLLLLLALL